MTILLYLKNCKNKYVSNQFTPTILYKGIYKNWKYNIQGGQLYIPSVFIAKESDLAVN
jgi:hypothetical protein